MTLPVNESQKARYNLDPGSFFVHHFWGRRLDGVAINEAPKIVCILEFERSTDRDEGFLEVKDAEANEQRKNIINALKAAVPEWEFEQTKTSSMRSKLLFRSGNLSRPWIGG